MTLDWFVTAEELSEPDASDEVCWCVVEAAAFVVSGVDMYIVAVRSVVSSVIFIVVGPFVVVDLFVVVSLFVVGCGVVWGVEVGILVILEVVLSTNSAGMNKI